MWDGFIAYIPMCQELYSLKNPISKTLVSLWTQESNLKCNDLFVPAVSDCPLETMNALVPAVESLLGRWQASQRSSPEHCLQPDWEPMEAAVPLRHCVQRKRESSGVLGQPGPGSTQGGGILLKREPWSSVAQVSTENWGDFTPEDARRGLLLWTPDSSLVQCIS